MENTGQLKEFFLNHQDACWQEMRRSKETKDKIVFFIGTLFVTVLFGSSVLIYKSNQADKTNIAYVDALDKLYVLQYMLMHFFFLLLFLYYTYNNIQEKLYSIDLQCCQAKMLSLSEEYRSNIKVPFGFFKRHYIDGKKISGIKPKWFKHFSNAIMIAVYTSFSMIPLIFNKDFTPFDKIGTSSVFQLKISWLIIWGIGILITFIIVTIGDSTINRIKEKLKENWDIDSHNHLGI